MQRPQHLAKPCRFLHTSNEKRWKSSYFFNAITKKFHQKRVMHVFLCRIVQKKVEISPVEDDEQVTKEVDIVSRVTVNTFKNRLDKYWIRNPPVL
ncbi:hypothetical protein FHG87_020146 [Trinorchestia longiramus]|nr:hypothetical protein FHG87_020146 [Trinorchestia longiramus]